MLDNINMEFIQAFNPLYAIPIVAVIICAFIVYALGFKSPVQPPSFEGIEEEKKYPKKRRGKETQKSNKLIQNGKVNGSTVTKSTAVPAKKKETVEKSATSEKSSAGGEKSTAAPEKKASKKNKSQSEKKLTQEKKKESFTHDELNDDGWVQLISKKGRKNRKKDDVAAPETTSVSAKATEANKSDNPVEESPQKKAELHISDASAQSTKDKKQPTPATIEEKVAKDVKPETSSEKSEKKDIIVEDSKTVNNVEKQPPKEKQAPKEVQPPKEKQAAKEVQPPKEVAAKGVKVSEESGKSKKKKKKNSEVVHPQNEAVGSISVSEASAEQVSSETVAPNKTAPPNTDVIDSPQVNSNKVEGNQQHEVKTSNVAFDELAGLYPEPKEQKKKKKVRRDH
ncbi:neurofilament heavy polypeptide-like [Argiope bruennichi]|uniref:Uncharacterized protein n=1 Tax=Argiope bruennichi TaxID=94029 RepID=A0A8T0FIQ6_ARGBR|nr:neurofilament heavy polypeptide-like [Argiope bruennichi]KAF8790826.1 hypothetical protein HNY73_005786 [Argiope bruennichi]